MRNFFSILVFCFWSINIIGQQRPIVLPEDLNESSLDIKCYCKPGVRNKTRSKGVEISYQYLGSGDISAPNDEFLEPFPRYSKFRNFRTKLSIPVLRGEQFKAILGFSYAAEQYELTGSSGNDFQGLVSATDNTNFKNTSANISLAFSPNATNYIGGKFSLSYKGSYSGLVDFSSRYAVYSGGIAYGIKKNEDNEWGFGIGGSRNFRNQGLRVLPFVFWNKTINDQWGFQITFPASYNLRHNVNDKTILIASANYNGESYSFDQVSVDNRIIAFNHSEILTLLKLQREIIPWLWLDLQAGYHFNFNSNFELQTTRENLLDIDPGNSILVKVGVFISPPDKFLDKKKHEEH